MSKHVREKCGKLCFSSILSSKSGITPTKIDTNWRHSNSICSTVRKSNMQVLSSICQSMGRKLRNTVYFQYSKFQKGHNSYKNWSNMTTLKLDLKYSRNSYAKVQLNMSKHVLRGKCGKPCISSILSSKRGLTPTKIDGNWRHSNLICSTVKQCHMQNFSAMCQLM